MFVSVPLKFLLDRLLLDLFWKGHVRFELVIFSSRLGISPFIDTEISTARKLCTTSWQSIHRPALFSFLCQSGISRCKAKCWLENKLILLPKSTVLVQLWGKSSELSDSKLTGQTLALQGLLLTPWKTGLGVGPRKLVDDNPTKKLFHGLCSCTLTDFVLWCALYLKNAM